METWKGILSYEGLYEASNLGRIRRIGTWSDGRKTQPVGVMKLRVAANGYTNVSLCKDSRKRLLPVHCLVYTSFNDDLPHNYAIKHKNGDRSDNRVENLVAYIPEKHDDEAWKAIPGYVGLYEVSNHGAIRRTGAWSDGRATKPRAQLCLKITQNGYCRVTLFRGGLEREFPVHRLVYTAFLGQLPEGLQINHKNGCKADNRPDNLEAVTPSENQFHAYRILGHTGRKGSKHHMAKLSERDILAIRSLHRSGHTGKHIASLFKVSATTISTILNGHVWTHVS